MSDQEATTPAGDELSAKQAEEQASAARAAYAEAAGDDPASAGVAAEDADAKPTGAEADVAEDDAEAAGVEADVEDPRSKHELLQALRAAETQRDEYLADVQRLQAEFDNFRKRTMREGADQRSAGVVELTEKLLDVLDDFDMALMSVDKTDDIASLHKGLELVYSKLISTLKSAGLERIASERVPFDPERHEAVQQVQAEDGPHEHPIVVDVLRAGYEMRGRVIRAAMVKVAQ